MKYCHPRPSGHPWGSYVQVPQIWGVGGQNSICARSLLLPPRFGKGWGVVKNTQRNRLVTSTGRNLVRPDWQLVYPLQRQINIGSPCCRCPCLTKVALRTIMGVGTTDLYCITPLLTGLIEG